MDTCEGWDKEKVTNESMVSVNTCEGWDEERVTNEWMVSMNTCEELNAEEGKLVGGKSIN